MFKWLGRAMATPKSRATSRLCGTVGWLGVIILQFTAFFMQLPLPKSYEMFLITCAALTGIEILEGIVVAFKDKTPRKMVEETFELPTDNVSESTLTSDRPSTYPGIGTTPTYEDLTGRHF